MIRALMLMLLLGGLLAPVVKADDLILADGRYLQVKILEVDERGLHVHRLDNGGRIFLPWALLREEDRHRLKVAYGLEEEERKEVTQPGVRLLMRSGDEFRGVPKTEFDAQSVPDPVEIWVGGKLLSFPKENIRSLAFIEVPVLEAFSKETLYERQLEELAPSPDDLDGHLEMVRYAADITYWQKAIEHLLIVQAIDDLYEPEWVQNQLARYEELAKNQAISDAIWNAKRRAYAKRFDEALAQLQEILGLQTLPPELKAVAEDTVKWVSDQRWEHNVREVRKYYFHFLDRALAKKSRDAQLSITDAQRYARRELHQEIVNQVAEKLQLNPKEEVPKMWTERQTGQPRSAWYGSGSFIVLGEAAGARERERALQQQMARAQAEARRRNGNSRSLSAGIPQYPKPKTREEWWKGASPGTKADWMKAYFAENGGQVELVGERRAECPTCTGNRVISFRGSQGQTIQVTCPRCAGHGYDKGVAFK